MNRIGIGIVFLVIASVAWSLGPTLGASAELTMDAPWTTPVTLEFPEAGRYRLEATGLGGDPVEMVIERKEASGAWIAGATNRTLRGSVEAVADWAVEFGETWRVRPPRAVPRTVILRLKRVAFSNLRDSLKQELTAGPEASLPLKKRLELPLGTGGPGLTATVGEKGDLWVGWLVAQGTAAEVWDAGARVQVGSPIASSQGGPWPSMELDGSATPVLVGHPFTTAQGTFRYETNPTVRVFRLTAGGWVDLELPQNHLLNQILFGSTEDGLYALLASTSSKERAFYSWRSEEGWTAFPPPPSDGPPLADLWSATNGAGSLFALEGRGTTLTLRQFDGTAWMPPLDLSPLVNRGLVGAILIPPSLWSKTGTLVVATDRVAVYDLP